MKLLKYKMIFVFLFLILFELPTNALLQSKKVVVNVAISNQSDSLIKQLPKVLTKDSLIFLNETYRERIEKYDRFWHRLIPNQMKFQYAGSIGVVALGIGWHYGYQQRVWETDVLFGYLPPFHTKHSKMTLTLKQSYVPFQYCVYKHLSIEPLACGIFFNTVFGEHFWTREPSKYPIRYYGFSTKIRSNIFIGERLRYDIPIQKRRGIRSVLLYYELSTNDLYIVSYATNHYLSLYNILSLSFGAKIDIF